MHTRRINTSIKKETSYLSVRGCPLFALHWAQPAVPPDLSLFHLTRYHSLTNVRTHTQLNYNFSHVYITHQNAKHKRNFCNFLYRKFTSCTSCYLSCTYTGLIWQTCQQCFSCISLWHMTNLYKQITCITSSSQSYIQKGQPHKTRRLTFKTRQISSISNKIERNWPQRVCWSVLILQMNHHSQFLSFCHSDQGILSEQM